MVILENRAVNSAPIRLERTQFESAEVFSRVDGTGSVILCEDDTLLDAPTRKAVEILFCGGRYGPHGGGWLFYVGLWVPDEFRDEFLAWYEIEHMPMLLECDSWDGCRFVEEKVASGCQFYALHQLSDKKALDSNERTRSRSTPWFKRLAQNDWFDAAFTRTLCQRAEPAPAW